MRRPLASGKGGEGCTIGVVLEIDLIELVNGDRRRERIEGERMERRDAELDCRERKNRDERHGDGERVYHTTYLVRKLQENPPRRYDFIATLMKAYQQP